MSFLDNWNNRRRQRKIEKYAQHLCKRSSSRDSRLQAIDFLKDDGSSEAISALLQRFRLTVPELTQDEEEKEYICSVITDFGDKAKEPLLDFIKRHDEVMKPLTLLSNLISSDEMIDILINRIQEIGELYSAMKTIKVVEILRHLAQYSSPKLVKLSMDIISRSDDDEVILAAIEVLEQQADEHTRIPLLELAADPDTTQRITVRIGDLLVKLHWSLKGLKTRKELEVKLKTEFYTVKGGFLKRKNLRAGG